MVFFAGLSLYAVFVIKLTSDRTETVITITIWHKVIAILPVRLFIYLKKISQSSADGTGLPAVIIQTLEIIPASCCRYFSFLADSICHIVSLFFLRKFAERKIWHCDSNAI